MDLDCEGVAQVCADSHIECLLGQSRLYKQLQGITIVTSPCRVSANVAALFSGHDIRQFEKLNDLNSFG